MSNEIIKPSRAEGSTKIKTGTVALSYPNLYEPKAYDGAKDPVYSIDLIFDSSNTELRDTILAAEKQAKQNKTGTSTWKSKYPVITLGNTIIANKLAEFDDPSYIEEHGEEKVKKEKEKAANSLAYLKDKIRMRVKSELQPEVIGRKKENLLDLSKAEFLKKVFPGVTANVCVRFYAWENTYGKGVSIKLISLQVIGGGEPIVSISEESAEDEFDALESPADSIETDEDLFEEVA